MTGLVLLSALVLAASSLPASAYHLVHVDRTISNADCEGVTSINDVCSKDCTSKIKCQAGTASMVTDCSLSTKFCHKTATNIACNRISQCGGPIWCTDVGVFPDPKRCQIYHTCNSANALSTVQDCADSAFDLSTHACGLPLDDVTCQGEGPVPECRFPQQQNTLDANPMHYYRCLMLDGFLYPHQYSCNDGEVYDVVTKKCLQASATTTQDITITELSTSELATDYNEIPLVLAASSLPASAYHLVHVDRTISNADCEGVTSINVFCSKDCTAKIKCQAGTASLVTDCSLSNTFCYKTDTTIVCNKISQCGGPIWCVDVGVFPDPDKCEIYHTCNSANAFSTVQDCADSTAFDLSTHACGLPLDDVTCQGEGPVPECRMPLQQAPLDANPMHYYSCMKLDGILYPHQYRCKEDEVYYAVSKQCILASATTTPTSTETTTATTPTSTETTTATTPTSTETTTATTPTSTETTTATTPTSTETTTATTPTSTETTTATTPTSTETTTATTPTSTETTTATTPTSTETTTATTPTSTETTTATIPTSTETTTATTPTSTETTTATIPTSTETTTATTPTSTETTTETTPTSTETTTETTPTSTETTTGEITETSTDGTTGGTQGTTDNTATTENPTPDDGILSIVLGGVFTAIVIAAIAAGGVVYLKKRKLKAAVPRKLGSDHMAKVK